MALHKVGTGAYGGQGNLAEVLIAPRTVEGRHGLSVAVHCPAIVALEPVGLAEALVRQRIQGDIPTSRGERQGTMGRGNGLVMHAHEIKMVRQKKQDMC